MPFPTIQNAGALRRVALASSGRSGNLVPGSFSMRNLFKLSLLAAALALAGCGFSPKSVELDTVEPQSQYDNRQQDALGPQKYTEAQMLYQRRLNGFQNEIDELNKKRESLDAALNARAYESGLSEAPASVTEAGRIEEYHSAARASQARVAEETSRLSIKQSLIENRRDKDLLEADSRAAKEIGEVEANIASELAVTEERVNQDVDGRRAIDTAARLREAQQFDDQRFTLALANADAQKLAEQKLLEEKGTLSRLVSESDARGAQNESRINDLKRQIAEIEAQMTRERSQDATLVSAQQNRVSVAQAEVQRLAEISQKLKTSTVASAGLSTSGGEYIQAKQAEMARARSTLDIQKTKRIAGINERLAQEKNAIIAKARTDLASISATTEMAKANVVAPVLTGRAVYGGNNEARPPAALVPLVTRPLTTKPVSLPRTVQAPPVLTINRFEPKVDDSKTAITNESIGGALLAGGASVNPPGPQASAMPLVIAPKTRSVYEVFYTYKDEGSWNKFQQYLKAYGITDFISEHSNKTGTFFIYCGRYYDQEQAASRVQFLNSKTSTKHVQVRETVVPL